MSDYSNNYNGSGKDDANSIILGADLDTQFNSIASMSATKMDNVTPATDQNIAILQTSDDQVGDGGETIAQVKSFAKRDAIYLPVALTSSTVDFNAGGTITRASGTVDLSVFKSGDVVTVTGTTNNNTTFTLTADASATSMSVTPNPTAESGEAAAVFNTQGVVGIIDEDAMTTDSASLVPSQQSVKAYVDSNSPQWRFLETRTLEAASNTSELAGTFNSATTRIKICLENADPHTSALELHLKDSAYSTTGDSVLIDVDVSAPDALGSRNETAGIQRLANSNENVYGTAYLEKVSTSSHVWTITGTAIDDNTGDYSSYAGWITLSSAITTLKVTHAATGAGGNLHIWEYY